MIDCISMSLFSPIRMKNAISSYSYNDIVFSGYNEALIDTAGSQLSSNLIPYDNTTFCLYGNSSNDYTMNYQSHCSIIFSESTSIHEYPFQEERQLNFMHQPCNSYSLQQSTNEATMRNARKRTAEAFDATQGSSSSSHGLINTETNEDRRRLKGFQEKQPKVQREKVVRRRSQKLTDKITALQKLVSPYGKTDTASVLLEASISIEALQHQIKELFQLIPVQEMTNMIRVKGSDLQSRGLCLVPSVFLEEFERQSSMHCLLQ